MNFAAYSQVIGGAFIVTAGCVAIVFLMGLAVDYIGRRVRRWPQFFEIMAIYMRQGRKAAKDAAYAAHAAELRGGGGKS